MDSDKNKKTKKKHNKKTLKNKQTNKQTNQKKKQTNKRNPNVIIINLNFFWGGGLFFYFTVTKVCTRKKVLKVHF